MYQVQRFNTSSGFAETYTARIYSADWVGMLSVDQAVLFSV